MFPEMRRKKQLLSQKDAEAVLKRGTSGVLSLLGNDGYPYGVPLSYIYHEGKLLFHCALTGHKMEAIQREEKCSFCVIDQDKVVPEKFTTYFRSVIVFGRIHPVEDKTSKQAALEALGNLLCPGNESGLAEEISSLWDRVCVLELHIEHMTGKEAKELVSQGGEE